MLRLRQKSWLRGSEVAGAMTNFRIRKSSKEVGKLPLNLKEIMGADGTPIENGV